MMKSFWSKSKIEWGSLALLAFVVLLGGALRLYGLDAVSLTGDESRTLLFSREPLLRIPGALERQGAHPPLWFFLTHFLLYLGEDEIILRLPAVLLGIATLPLLYLVGRLLLGKAQGLMAVFFLAVTPSHILASQRGRMYSALAFFSLLSLYFLHRALATRDRKFWAGFALATLLNIYTHYFALFVLLSGLLYGLWTIYRERPRLSPGSWPSIFRDDKGFILSLLVIFAVYLPWLPALLRNLISRQIRLESGSLAPKVSVLKALTISMSDFNFGGEVTAYLLALFFLLGLASLFLRSREKTFTLTLLWFLPPYLALLMVGGTRKFNVRYVLYLLPIYLLVASEGIMAAGRWVEKEVKRAPKGVSSLVSVALLLLLLGTAGVGPLLAYYRVPSYDWRELATFLSAVAEEGQVVVVEGSSIQSLLYYAPNLENVYSAGGSLERVKEVADGRRVWFIFHPSGEADPRREILKWVGENRFLTILMAWEGYGPHSLYYGRPGYPLGDEEVTAILDEAAQFFAIPTIHSRLGWIYQERGDLERAAMEYEEADRLAGSEELCQYFLEKAKRRGELGG